MSLLHICCLRQCLVAVALKNLAVQFLTSITSEYEKIDLYNCMLILITRAFQLHAYASTLRLVSGKLKYMSVYNNRGIWCMFDGIVSQNRCHTDA